MIGNERFAINKMLKTESTKKWCIGYTTNAPGVQRMMGTEI